MLVLLQEGVLTEKEFNEFIPELSKNVESTTNMLNNLLSWTKTQMQGLDVQKEKFDLFLIANGLISLYAKNILEKRLIIENQIPQNTIINSDKNIIEFVLRNIFFNAIKFTHLNGKIKLSVEILSNNSVKICVEDNGIGIPKENISQIEKGVNISTAGTSKEKGNGLGLMLCKDFIENVGGSLTITSEINKGSRFCFTIPQK
jgi:signal transduction histidine kinase